MKSIRLASLALLVVWLAQAACNMPAQKLPDTGGRDLSLTQVVINAPPSATPLPPTATSAPQNTQPMSVTLGVISGIVWRDVCIQGTGDSSVPSTGCVAVSQDEYQANGFREFNEPGIPNLTISLGAGACPAPGAAPATLSAAVTDSEGTYTFAGLVAAKYCVFVDPAVSKNPEILASGGWTFPNSDYGGQTVTLTSGEHKTDVNFGWDGDIQVSAAEEIAPVSSSVSTPPPVAVNPSGDSPAPVETAPAPTPIPQNPTPPAPAQALPAGLDIPITGVSFEPGTTSTTAEGSLAPGQGEGYALRASKGYALIATLLAKASDVYLDISAEDGTPVEVVRRPDGSYLVSELPSNTRYIVKVIAGGQASPYSLDLEIPALIAINQSSGSASGGGTIQAGRLVSYLLRGKAGQNLSVSVTSPGSTVALSISGLHDGQVLVGPDASSSVASWSGRLPQTQAYLIQAVPSVESTSFTVQVTLSE